MLTHHWRPGQNWVMVSGRDRYFYELERQSLRAPWKYGVIYIHSKIIFFCRLQFEFQVCVALERLCSWDVPNIAGWTSSVLPFNRAFPWAFSLTNVLRNSFILVFIHGSFNHTEQELRIQRRDGEGPLLKAWEYQAGCQAHGLSTVPGICPVYCGLLSVFDGFKLFALTNCTANRVFVQMTKVPKGEISTAVGLEDQSKRRFVALFRPL